MHIRQCMERLDAAHKQQIGYPLTHHMASWNQNSNGIDSSASAEISHVDFTPLLCLQKYYINNVGDPSQVSSIKSHTHDFEMGVINFFASYWKLDDVFGYITNGGSESNLQALYCAREMHPDGVLYCSADSHFSVFKAAHLLRIKTHVIQTNGKGEIDYEDLEHMLTENFQKPAILNLNIGTTMWGAIDVPERVHEILEKVGFTNDRIYIHLDAALSGIFLPVLPRAPEISFRIPGIKSISMSGHKFLGTPFPCGVVLIRKGIMEAIQGKEIEYISSRDVTLSCSRNGHSALYLWYLLSQIGVDGIRHDVERCINYAQRLKDMLIEGGLKAWLLPHSITVVFEKLDDPEFAKCWQIACSGDIWHVVVMPHHQFSDLKLFAEEVIARKKALDRCKGYSPQKYSLKRIQQEDAKHAAYKQMIRCNQTLHKRCIA